MSTSRASGAEKPAAKRPRSYMDGPCNRKLSIMSTVLPTPSQKSKEQILSFLGGYVRQTMSISRALGAEKPSRSCIPQKGGGGGGARARARARARAPPLFPVPSARAGFFLYIYLSISTYLSLYIIYIYICYIYIYISLSLF